MNRVIVYPGAIPQDSDILWTERYTEIALGMVMRAAFGTSTVIDGLTVAQQASPNMTVQVGQGAILTQTVIDPTGVALGSLPADTTTNLVKIGINTAPTNMSALVAPPVSGQSQNWLVQAQFLEQDTNPIALPYYNAANPSVPYTGPANSGTAQNTLRANTVQLQWKGGVAATTGQQNTPTPDAGWVGVAIVTVANGQTSVTNANITPYSSAPYVPTKLPQQRLKLTANYNLYVSPFGSDTANSGLSAASPFATLQKAWNYVVSTLDLNGFQVTVNVANGTYNQGAYCSGAVVGAGNFNSANAYAPVSFVGNTGSPSSVTVNVSAGNAFVAGAGAWISVSGFTILAGGTGGNGNGLLSQTFGIIVNPGSNVFGACGNNQLLSYTGGFILCSGNYTVSGAAVYHLNAASCGNILFSPAGTVTVTGSPAFSSAFVLATQAGVINAGGWTFSGAATGARYNAVLGGVIQTNGGGASFFPGSSSGTAPTGYYN